MLPAPVHADGQDIRKQVLGPETASTPVSSVKSMIGHALGASGMLSLIAVLLGMRDGFIPPTTNLDQPDPECDLDHVANQPREAAFDTAMINAFDPSDTNASIVVRKG